MTMQAYIVLLTVAYAALSTLLLVVMVRLAIPRAVKIAAILAMSAFNVGVFFWTQGLVGWSSATAVPERFQVLWARVVEPNASRNIDGAIHLWVEALDENNIPSGVPRAYLLPYSQALASRATETQSEIKKGNPQGGRTHIYVPEGEGAPPIEGTNVRTATQGVAPGGDPSGGGLLDPKFLGGQSKSVDLIPLPRPVLPPKEL
jgi:hypothetical protein